LSANKQEPSCIARLPDEEAWKEFVDSYSNLIFYSIRKSLPDADEDTVRDLYVDFLIRMKEDDCRRLKSFKGRAKFSWWLTLTVHNFALNYARKKTVKFTEVDDDEIEERTSDDTDPDKAILRDDGYEIMGKILVTLRRIIDELSPEDKALLSMKYMEGMSADEIASSVGMSRRTFYRRMEGILNLLAERMEAAGLRREMVLRVMDATEGKY